MMPFRLGEMPVSLITLTSDFGLQDTFVGVMKGVILGIAPDVTIVDLTHEIPPQDVMAAALALESAIPHFPRGAVHLAVVDPGVGSDRHAVAIETDHGLLVGPDNGLFTAVLEHFPLRRAVRLTNTRYFRPHVSPTFHGRDIFAPIAAHLAAGAPLSELGDATPDVERLDLSRPTARGRSIEAHVIHIDRFGNLVTDLTESAFAQMMDAAAAEVTIIVRGDLIQGLSRTFADVPRGEPLAYFGSGRRLEVGVREGNAAHTLGAVIGTTVTLRTLTE